MSTQASLRVSHIRFVPDAEATGSVLRRFTQPRSMMAIQQRAEFNSLPMDQPWPETVDDLYVVLASIPVAPEVLNTMERWLAPPDHPDGRPAIIVQTDGGSIRWRPGRAFVEGKVDGKNLLAALIDFSFLESELRRLEQRLIPYETSAPGDAAFAYQIKPADRAQWKRLGQMMPGISRLRLAFARLDPCLRQVSPSLPPDARKAVTRLVSGADVLSRLDAFDERLEACEDLYEGAVDRIADFRWYRNGERLEIAIVILLALEVIFSACLWGLGFRTR